MGNGHCRHQGTILTGVVLLRLIVLCSLVLHLLVRLSLVLFVLFSLVLHFLLNVLLQAGLDYIAQMRIPEKEVEWTHSATFSAYADEILSILLILPSQAHQSIRSIRPASQLHRQTPLVCFGSVGGANWEPNGANEVSKQHFAVLTIC